MPHPDASHDPIPAALRDAATTLKAAIVVSAAAILSQADADLRANAAAAVEHFDSFGRKLDTLRTNSLNDRISVVASKTDIAKTTLFEVVGSAEREGLATFAERVGELGQAFNEVMAQAGLASTPPFQFDQFFLESMHDLGQRDWSDAG
ncbi:hypothetical protein [Tardiphaga sp.]|uniref:hypothetical protein n=1 Tax=Tardiphaga sp. TaxID=1926292 RepID=UPI00262148F3|nr:hypothetical protein [Tardiphaga sp.]MDB5620198.1 hypothetical protein [Tardiphaga sp.]